jgi:site-specific recombinase XerD
MNGRIEKEILAKEKMQIKLSNMPEIFTIFYNWMDARDRSYTTMDNYIRHVDEFMHFFTKGKSNEKFYLEVTDDDIERYMTSIKNKSVGDDIRAAKWSSLNTFFKFLSQKKYITNNPMLLTERPRIRTEHTVTYMTPKEIESIFDRIQKESRKRDKNRDTCIVALGITTGLRVSAITNINVEDIDFTTNTIKVIEKGRKIKQVPFAENLRNVLLIWLKDREIYFNGNNEGPLFLSQQKKRISPDGIGLIIKKYTDHLSKHITPHKMRSSTAMNLHGAGTDILTIASLLGHENITTTQRYVQAYEESKKKATNILDNLI